jgi:hypothetical protein
LARLGVCRKNICEWTKKTDIRQFIEQFKLAVDFKNRRSS